MILTGSDLVIVGTQGWNFTGFDSQWRIEKRSVVDGALDPTFGAVTSDPSVNWDEAHAVGSDGSAIYVAGYVNDPPDGAWRIEKRRLSDGSLDVTFGNAGAVTSNPGGDVDKAYGLALDASFLYVVGSDVGPGDLQWRIEKRSLADGSLDGGFGTGGAVTVNPSAEGEAALAVAIADPHLLVIGSDRSPWDAQWRVEKRLLSDGSPDLAFGTGGVVTFNPSGDWDMPTGITIDGSFIYVIGSDMTPVTSQWRMEKRFLSDGSLDAAFGTGGVVTSDPSGGGDEPIDIVVGPAHIYGIGQDIIPGDVQWRIEKRCK
jgi:uncharacterized delta-60 repeat protein